MKRVAVTIAVVAGLVLPAAPSHARVARVSGQVLDQSGKPASGACAYAEQGGHVSGWASVGAVGGYLIDGLMPGIYRVRFDSCRERPGQFSTSWYDGGYSAEQATDVIVVAHTRGIDGRVTRSGWISGRVLGSAESPVPGACVTALRSRAIWASARADASGAYALFLSDGNYRIRFDDCEPAASPRYAHQFYPGVELEDDAAAVTVVLGRATEGVDARLWPGAVIAGSIWTPEGSHAGGACVTVYAGARFVATTRAWDGTYSFEGLQAGTYLVNADPCAAGDYSSRWYGGAASRIDATPILLARGQWVGNIDISLGADGKGVLVATVTDEAGDPISGICVAASTDEDLLRTGTDEDGRARLLLPVGTYQVQFSDCHRWPRRVDSEWYDDSPTRAGATAVTISTDTTTTIAASLAPSSEPPPPPPPRCDPWLDRDRDRIGDCDELDRGTDLWDPDTDGDTFGDGFEVYGGPCLELRYGGGSDPLDPASTPATAGTSLGFSQGLRVHATDGTIICA